MASLLIRIIMCIFAVEKVKQMIEKIYTPELITLSNGLRLLYLNRAYDPVEYFGVVVDAGSRDDMYNSHGLAHFVEHTLFKGTTKRKSWHIINRMESCGGELNAFTTKESTTIYSVFPTGNLSRAVDLVADLVINSQFPEKELEKEREVVADEISSYRDIPAEAVYDDFEDLLFAGSDLGHNILGNEKALRTFDSLSCREFISKLYTCPNMVAFYSGPMLLSRVVKLIERSFEGLSKSEPKKTRMKPVVLPNFNEYKYLSNHQAHSIVGARVCDMYSSQRLALSLMVNLLGGPGMNSLLNVELREKRGLVYSVDASATLMTDCGVFAIYFGCDPDDTELCRRIIDRTIDNLAAEKLSERRFAAIVRQHVGQMIVGAENKENTILSMARTALYRDRVESLQDIVAKLSALRPEELCDAAQMIAPENLSMLTFC